MNNREIVALVYLCVFLLLILVIRDARSSLWQVLRLLLFSKLGFVLAIYAATIGAAIFVMSLLGFWTWSLLGSTLLWFILVGFAWFFKINDAGKDSDFFKRRLFEAIGISAILEVFVGLVALPLWAEFVVQGLLLFVILMNAFAQTDSKFRAVANITSILLAIAGISLFLYTLVTFIGDWSTQNWRDVGNQFLLPIWLTVAVIPCLYLIGLFAGYESLVTHMSFWNDRRRPRLRALVGTAVALRGSLVEIDDFRGPKTQEAAQASSVKTARTSVEQFRRDRAAEHAAQAAARQRLIENTGAVGVDEAGLQLDRREFAETKKALRWIANCHMGWFQCDDRPDRYRDDLMDMFGDLTHEGLPEDHGVIMQVPRDGQAWYAYRTTPSGHVFAIGASGPPPSQLFWDGLKQPPGFPSKKSGWTSFMEADRPEWREEAAT